MKTKKLFLTFVLLFVSLLSLTACQLNMPGVSIAPTGEAYWITFESNGGTEIAELKVREGSKIEKPSNPEKAKYIFDGWYTSEDFATAWDFENDTVASDLTLYAKWVKDLSKIEYEEVSYTLNVTGMTAGSFAEDAIYSRFTIGAGLEIRNRNRTWTNPEDSSDVRTFEQSIKIGNSGLIYVDVPDTGVLSFWLHNGSSGAEYQYIVVTDPNGVAQEIEFEGTITSSPVVRIDVPVTSGVWTIGRKSGTIDFFLFELNCLVEVSEEVGFSVVANGKTDYIQGEEIDYSGLQIQNEFENGKTGIVSLEDVEVDTTNYNPEVPGVYDILVYYGIYEPITYQVTVYEVKSIELGYDAIEKLSSNSSAGNGVYYNHNLQQVYGLNETLDLTGMTVIINGECDGVEKQFIVSDNLTYSNFDSSSAGEKEITVTYSYLDQSVSASFTVNVVDTKPSVVNEVVQLKVEQGYAGEIGAVVDGYNMFNTINQALDYISSRKDIEATDKKLLVIGEGLYNEKLEITVPNLTIKGAGVEKTTIEWDSLFGLTDKSGFVHTTDSTATVAVRDSAIGVVIEDITLSNYWNSLERFDEALGVGYSEHRALALLVQADQFIMRNAALLGYQDTVEFFTGRQLLENVLIKGTTDFIFGTNNTTYFKNCTIYSIYNGKTDGGYITAFKGNNKGDSDYVQYGAIFDQCSFTADAQVLEAGNTAIGRPWAKYAAVMVMNSELGSHISLAGSTGSTKNERYVSMNAKPTDETVKYTEYKNTGAGALTEEVAGMRFVSDEEAANYNNIEVIFGKSNGLVNYSNAWNPYAVEEVVDRNIYYYFNGQSSLTGTSYTYDQTIQKGTGTFGNMTIDATNGKVAARDSDTQVNTGSILSFDVTAGSTVIVTSYPGYHNYSLNGVAADADTFEQVYAEATKVVFEATGSTYLYSIIIIPGEEASEEPVDRNIYYYFNGQSSETGTSYTYDQTIQKGTGTFGDMTIDATNGKVAARGSDTQVNTGSILSFDVTAGSTVIVTSYPGYHNYSLNGVAADADTFEQVYAEATKVVFEATGSTYLYSIIIIPGEEAEKVIIEHNFETNGLDSEFFTISGNLSGSKGTVEYNGVSISQCLKIESKTSISFTIETAMTLTLVVLENSKYNFKINGEKQVYDSNIIVIELEAGSYEITKADTQNLYYMSLE